MARRRDIAIAGCGPAGLAAALLLAREGHRVTIFERFDSPAPIGSGLMIQPTGLAVLRSLGLAEALTARSARIDRLHGKAGQRVVLDVRYSALKPTGLCGFGVHRATLFDVLYDAAVAAGVEIETGRAISGSAASADGRFLTFAGGGRSATFDLVVDASGTATTLAAPTGRTLAYGALWTTVELTGDFATNALAQRYRRASEMAGVLPIGKRPESPAAQAAMFWSLRSDRLAAWRTAGLDAWKADVLALWPDTAPLLAQIASADQLTFARYAHRTVAAPTAARLIHIGDAWHSASPQLGQGANMALLDAFALARALSEHGDIEDALARAVSLRARHVRLYQALTWLFTPVYQSDSRVLPFVRDRLVGPLSRLWPATRIQAAMVAGLIGDPLEPLAMPLPRQGAMSSVGTEGNAKQGMRTE